MPDDSARTIRLPTAGVDLAAMSPAVESDFLALMTLLAPHYARIRQKGFYGELTIRIPVESGVDQIWEPAVTERVRPPRKAA